MTAAPHIGWRATLFLLFAAVALRGWDLGDPVIHVDEQWYLLVGDRMLDGAVPYLDIWDRKPIGLFLLFAGFRLMPGDGILAYQVAALLAAAATAMIAAAASRRIGASATGSAIAGVAYLLGLALLGGRGGQAPVFYNLPMTAAGWLTMAAFGRQSRGVVASGALACAFAGMAIQMKYTPAVEGAFFGLAHLVALRRGGVPLVMVAGAAALWLACGLLPTAAAIGWYAAHGQLDAFWFANFTSIALRPGYPVAEWSMRLLGIAVLLSPLAGAAWLSWRQRPATDAALGAAAGWMGAALLGFLAIGTFFDHYALPLLAPLAVLAGPALGRFRVMARIVLGAWLAIWAVQTATARNDGPGARRVAAVVERNARGGCPYVFIGDTITYLLARTCLPTAYAFPNLLAYTTEQGATGIDEAAEVRRILGERPPVIVASTRTLKIWNPGSRCALLATLARDYRLVASEPRQGWRTTVWLRRDLPLR